MNNPKLSNIRVNRSGVLCFHYWYRNSDEIIDGLSMDPVFDNIDEVRVNDLLSNTDGRRYINFTVLQNK